MSGLASLLARTRLSHRLTSWPSKLRFGAHKLYSAGCTVHDKISTERIDGNGYSQNNVYSMKLLERSLKQTPSQMLSSGLMPSAQMKTSVDDRFFGFRNGLLEHLWMNIPVEYAVVR